MGRMYKRQKNYNKREKVTFGRSAEEWLSYKSKNLKYSTYIKYRSIYKNHLETAVSQMEISEIDLDILDSAVFHLGNAEKTLSLNLQDSIINLTNQVISFANENYGYAVPLLKHRKKAKPKLNTITIFSLREQAQIFQYIYDHMDISGVGILLCLSTGLRLGEICALKWEDIDLTNHILSVRRTVQRIEVDHAETKTMLMESEPKSQCSVREIPLSQGIIELLISNKSEAVYFMNGNKPMEPRSYQKKFKSILKGAGISDKNFHILRHTFATNCVNSGMDVKCLSELLGHSDVKITLNRYVHPTMDTKRRHINTLFDFYSQIYDSNINNK